MYRIVCTACESSYVGETEMPLLKRFKEHLADMQHNKNRLKPWSLHMNSRHASVAVPVSIPILGAERNLRKRKIKEAMFTERLRPDVNVKEEMNMALRFIH